MSENFQNVQLQDNNVPENNVTPSDTNASIMSDPLVKAAIAAAGFFGGIKLGKALDKEAESREKKGMFRKKETKAETKSAEKENAISKFLGNLSDEELDALRTAIDIQKELNALRAKEEELRAKM